MKKFICFLLLICICLSSISLVSCSKNDLNTDSSKKNKKDTETALSEDEIFDYIKQALENSVAYTGAYTVTRHVEEHESDGDIDGSKDTISLDPETKRYLYKDISYTQFPERYVEHHRVNKIFFQNDTYYDYYYRHNSNPTEYYTYMSEAQARYLLSSKYYNFFDIMADIRDVLPNISLAESIFELKSAYNEFLKDNIDDPQNDTASATIDITTKKIDDSFTLNISLFFTLDDESIRQVEISIHAINNMISKLKATDRTFTIEVDYRYEFDEKMYNSITVNPPKDTDCMQSTYFGKEINFHFKNAYTFSSFSFGENTIIDTYQNIINRSDISLSNYTWYTDEELTKKFDPQTVSEEDWFALENLYTEEKKDARTVIYYSHRHDINKSYSIVLGFDPVSKYGMRIVSDGNRIYFSEMISSDIQNFDVYINGEKQPQGSEYFEVDGTIIYEIEFVYKDSHICF